MVSVIFTKAWKAYAPGMCAGFSADQAELLYSFGVAKPVETPAPAPLETKAKSDRVKTKGK